MRVLAIGNMYPPHHLGGYELMWHSSMQRLRAKGHAVRVLTTEFQAPRPDPAIAEDPEVFRALDWYWREHAFPRRSPLERLRLERRNLEVLDRHLAEFRPDVLNWWAMGGMSMSLLDDVAGRGLPAVGVVVDEWLTYGPKVDAWRRMTSRLGPLGNGLAWLLGQPRRADLEHAAHWIFASETLRRNAGLSGFRSPGAEVLPAGVDAELFAPAPEQPWQWRLLYVGRIDQRKGITTAIRALAELEKGTLSVVGRGDAGHAAELRDLAGRLGVSARVSFDTVPRDRLPAAYAAADVTLFPVLWDEPWGLVPLEAMSVGRPVIATGTGGSAEYLRDGENCLIFTPRDDPRALADAVRGLAADESLRARLRESGYATAARYTAKAFDARVVAALEAAAGGD